MIRSFKKIPSKTIIKVYVFILTMVIVAHSCNLQNEDDISVKGKEEDLKINLRWFSGSFNQSEEQMRTGLTWALSYLGAELPLGSLGEAINTIDDYQFALDLSKVGFTRDAQAALQKIVTTIKESPAYRTTGSTELGRLIMLTLNTSYHYFEITGVPKTLEEFKSKYRFERKKVRVVNSSISNVNRLIEISEAKRVDEIAYFATEGEGEFEDGTFEAGEFEVLDFMPNGQFRFGLYDLNGKLKASANGDLTRAGKPAKCIWCHEIDIQPFFANMPVLPGEGFISEEDFLNIRNKFLLFVADHRISLQSEIDYTDRQAHTYMEHIYIGFMEPSLERISEEWGLSIETTELLLKNLPVHTQEEFGFKNLYDRKNVDKLAPYIVTEVPESAREFSANEPNFFF